MTLTDPRLAYGSLPILIWAAGPDGSCDYLNERWSELTGRPVEEMLGWSWTDRLHPDDRDQMLAEYRASVAERRQIRLEFRMLHQDGEYRWFLGIGQPCYRADGRFLGYSGCTTDVTDRRALEERLVELNRTGEIAQLAGGIAHDFNNLLTGILGHVALLLDERSLSPEARNDLAQIRHAADRAATLTRHLLAFSRRQLAPRFLDLNQLVAGTLSAIRQVAGSAVEVTHELEDGLEPVLADAGQLEHILIHLCAYAQASLPHGGRLRICTGRAQVDETLATLRPGLRPGSYVTLELGYRGAVLEPEAIGRAFQAPPPGSAGGQAADLSSVALIAKQSGGHIAVESTPESGTTFTLFIPRLEVSPEAAVGAEATAYEGSETILLVEDDPQVRNVGRRALERVGYTVLPAGDAEAAIALADRHPGHIHLLVTDVVLPRMSGRELAARLAIHRPAIKVLYVSGTSDGAIARHRMLEPDTEFLEKPFFLDHLLRKVRQILGVTLSPDEAAPWTQRSMV
jgi:two-component system cell cycle sensor histidine kinase/response regulator CckA